MKSVITLLEVLPIIRLCLALIYIVIVCCVLLRDKEDEEQERYL